MSQTNINTGDGWVMIEEFAPYYVINEHGQVRSLGGRSGSGKKMLKPRQNKEGYWHLDLTKDKKRHGRFIHRLVATTFIPNPENKPQINHIDFNPANCHVSNLEWCTPRENVQHTIRHGRKAPQPKGEDNKNSKLTNEQVREIKRLYGSMLTRDLAIMFGITSRNIRYIISGKRWSHVK